MGKYVPIIKRTGNPSSYTSDTPEGAFEYADRGGDYYRVDAIYEFTEVKRPEPKDHIILWQEVKGEDVWKTSKIHRYPMTKAKAEETLGSSLLGSRYKAVKIDLGE